MCRRDHLASAHIDFGLDYAELLFSVMSFVGYDYRKEQETSNESWYGEDATEEGEDTEKDC